MALEPGPIITVTFSSGRLGETDAGDFEFWTVYNQQAAFMARGRVGEDPGERFRRMEGLPGYAKPWHVASTASGLRPSTISEVVGWLNDHPEDATFAQAAEVRPVRLKVVRSAAGYGFVAA